MVAETIDLQRILNGLTFKESVEISEKKLKRLMKIFLPNWKRKDTDSESLIFTALIE